MPLARTGAPFKGRLRAASLVLVVVQAAGCVDGAAGADAAAARPGSTKTAARARVPADSLVRALGCGLCHAGLPVPAGPIAAPLEPGLDRDADAVWSRLRPDGGDHPDFHVDEREAVALARFLGADPRRARTTSAREAGRRHDVTSADGERLFVAFNCAACHARRGVQRQPNGAVLSMEHARVRADWLRTFLRAPHAVRPFGVRPGDGGRMPRFALSDEEIDSIATFLLARDSPLPDFTPSPLSSFATRKVEELMRARFSCLGCHALDGRGGRAGPDLTAAGHRLRPGYIRSILSDPGHVAPGTIMPATTAPEDVLDAIASALSARTAPPPTSAPEERGGYLSPLDHALTADPALAGDAAATRYITFCSACHGDGAGDGFNAAFLQTAPADHTAGPLMRTRTDARLYDAIAGGAFFLDGSPEMPAFGSRLTAAEIRELVRFIRSLCRCDQPAWAGDGTRRSGS